VHELSICQQLIDQVEAIAHEHGALRVNAVHLQIGPLAGIEIPLLKQAFTVACANTLAESAILETKPLPIRVRCRTCGAESEAFVNRLLCGVCSDWHTDLLSGDELLLVSLELDLEEKEEKHV
jgi:hydrogenase nickel incorporation protein HypA/HybF